MVFREETLETLYWVQTPEAHLYDDKIPFPFKTRLLRKLIISLAKTICCHSRLLVAIWSWAWQDTISLQRNVVEELDCFFSKEYLLLLQTYGCNLIMILVAIITHLIVVGRINRNKLCCIQIHQGPKPFWRWIHIEIPISLVTPWAYAIKSPINLHHRQLRQC